MNVKKQSKDSKYSDIIRKSEEKQKQQLKIVKNRCCPDCVNSGEGCLKLDHLLKDGVEIYKCANYFKI